MGAGAADEVPARVARRPQTEVSLHCEAATKRKIPRTARQPEN